MGTIYELRAPELVPPNMFPSSLGHPSVRASDPKARFGVGIRGLVFRDHGLGFRERGFGLTAL